MAESLSAERGSNGPDRASFLGFVERVAMIEAELQDARRWCASIRQSRKDLRKLIETEGFVLAEFDRALADAERSGEEREAADRAYRQNMAWLGKPIGFQTDIFDLAALPEVDLARAEREGFAAGKRGDRADSNSWTPGREEHQRWHSGWLRGQAEKVTKEIEPTEATPKRRGRPPGSLNKPKANGSDAEEAGQARPIKAPTGMIVSASPTLVAPADLEAQSIGREDGAAGHQDHAARYPAGQYGHADYWLGYTEGKQARLSAMASGDA